MGGRTGGGGEREGREERGMKTEGRLCSTNEGEEGRERQES